MLNDAKLDFWIKNNYNVLLKGRAGTGKTTMVIDAFNRHKLKWLYFAGATLDPHLHMVGIPREHTDTVTGESYLKMILPEHFAKDDIDAIFVDEYNRSHKTVRNALMELIQFRSINGRKFNNLKMIWTAINPSSDELEDGEKEYDVEEIDPAQLDRFPVQIEVPYKCDKQYFYSKFGENGNIGVEWWDGLDKKIRNAISPRRLDYALEYFIKSGDLNDIIPKKSGANLSQLTTQLKNGSFAKRLAELYSNKDDAATKTALLNENFFKGIEDLILKRKEYIEYFGYHYPSEKFNQMIITNDKFRNTILTNTDKLADISDQLKTIVDAGTAKQSILKELKNILNKNNLITAGSLEALFAEFYEIDDPFMGTDAKINRLTIAKILHDTDYEKIKYSQAIKAIAMNCGLVACTIGTIWAQSVQAFEKQAAALDDPSIGGFAAVYEQDVKLDKFFIKHVATDKDKLFKLEAHLTKLGHLK